MRAGDMVRFHFPREERPNNPSEWHHGLLIEYNTWEKVARILYDGEVISLRAEYTTLAKNGRASCD